MRLTTKDLLALARELLKVDRDLIRSPLDLEAVEGTVIVDRLGEAEAVFLSGAPRIAAAWLTKSQSLKGSPHRKKSAPARGQGGRRTSFW